MQWQAHDPSVASRHQRLPLVFTWKCEQKPIVPLLGTDPWVPLEVGDYFDLLDTSRSILSVSLSSETENTSCHSKKRTIDIPLHNIFWWTSKHYIYTQGLLSSAHRMNSKSQACKNESHRTELTGNNFSDLYTSRGNVMLSLKTFVI